MFGQICYVVLSPEKGRALIVDPGYDVLDQVIAVTEEARVQTEMILLTHEHHDHIGNLNETRRAFGCKVIASRKCSANIGDPKRNLSAYHSPIGYQSNPADLILPDHPSNLTCSGGVLEFHPTPGHSEGSLCIRAGTTLFTGDTLIKDHKTVVTLPGSNKQALSKSLEYIFFTFPGDTLVLPGHGKSFFLRDSHPNYHMRQPIAVGRGFAPKN